MGRRSKATKARQALMSQESLVTKFDAMDAQEQDGVYAPVTSDETEVWSILDTDDTPSYTSSYSSGGSDSKGYLVGGVFILTFLALCGGVGLLIGNAL